MSQTPLDKSRALLSREFHGMSSMSQYSDFSKLGQGTFGEVVKARGVKDKKLVALKSIIVHNQKGGFPITALREVNIMKRLKNKNVLQLLELICKRQTDIKGVKKLPVFYMVMPYMSYDLSGLLTNPKVKLTQAHIKCLMYQLLEGINYIHQQQFFHRDIKAANILIDHHGVLKIADFGLARNYEGSTPQRGKGPCGSIRRYTGLVVTRWYRAPELLLGNQRYTTAVDLWGVGCVFAEMFERNPILQGKSDLDQGRIIFELIGPPTQNNWKDYDKLPHANQFVFPASRRNLEQRFARVGKEGLSLLDGLLKLDPRLRLNALDALDHPYFTTKPLPCKPIELPKFEDCHEIDADKIREEQKKQKTNTRGEAWGTTARDIPKLPLGDTRYPAHIAPLPKNIPNKPRNPDRFYTINDRNNFAKESDPTSGLASANRPQPSSLPETPNRTIYNDYRHPATSRSHHQGYPNKRQRQDTDAYQYQPSSNRYGKYNNDNWKPQEKDDFKLDYSDGTLSQNLKSATTKHHRLPLPNGLPPPPPPPPPSKKY